MTELLLPRTDAGVLAQAVAVTVLMLAAAVALRRHPEWRLLAIGLGVFALGAMAVRALH